MIKRKKSQILFLIIIIEITIVVFCYLLHLNPFMPFERFFYNDLDKLRVHFQATTGPKHYVKEDQDLLKNLEIHKGYLNLSNTEIELVGDTSFRFEEDSLTGDKITLVFGKLIGATDKYVKSGSGTVPIFNVYYYTPVNYGLNGFASTIIILVSQLIILYFVIKECISLIKRNKYDV